jgi:isocitrate dehydrogenase (NAD+)
VSQTVVLIPGDGIGPEITRATRNVLEATGVGLRFEEATAGHGAFEATGDPLPPDTLAAIRHHGTALKGPLTTPVGKGFRSVNVRIRKELDLYANVRPIRSRPIKNFRARFEGVNLIVVRENTEGLYSGLEHMVVEGVAESLKIVTTSASRRIGEFAFGLATREGRRHVTAVHKANIMKLSDGLFLDAVRAVAEQHPDVTYDEVIVDAMSMKLVLHPERFDVLVMGNLYGDIMSDLAAGLIGGLGLAPSGNIGVERAVFEAVHGTAPDIAGRGIANPTALMLSSVMLLRHLGHTEAAAGLERAIDSALAGDIRTGDLGGSATTAEFAAAVVAAMEADAGS